MIDSAGIYRMANNLVLSHGTRNALEIASAVGINVVFVDYFTDNVKAVYINRFGLASSFFNDKLLETPYTLNEVGGHEMGHHFLHSDAAENGLTEFDLYHTNNMMEYEANSFAAHLIIDTDECMELVKNGCDVITAAKILNVELPLLLIKLQELKRLGYKVTVPITVHGDFWKNIRV